LPAPSMEPAWSELRLLSLTAREEELGAPLGRAGFPWLHIP
jgi:hypothetical protein